MLWMAHTCGDDNMDGEHVVGEVLDGEHVDGEVLVVECVSFGRRLVVLLISLHILPWRCTCI